MSRFRQIFDLDLAKNQAVEIVDKAVAPQRPYSPNRPQAAAFMLVGILLEAADLAMFKRIQKKPLYCHEPERVR